MPFPAIPSQIRCPQCEHPFVVEVRTIIDVGEEPELKEQFLRGQINQAHCPQCGTTGMLSTPLVYHDPEKELLATYVPSELGLSSDEQERTVGNLVNAVMNNMPQEQRKGYFLQPKTVLTYNGLLELVLEAEGFSKEMLEKQRQWFSLINDLLGAMDDEEALADLIDEHRADLDYEFFLMLAELIEAEEEQRDGEDSDLATLRDKLLEQVSPAMSTASSGVVSADELIDLLLETDEGDAWDQMVAVHLHRLDYAFFQTLSSRLEAAEAQEDDKESAALARLREKLLEAFDRQNQRVREAEDEASLLIMEMLEADDQEEAVREHRDDLDEIFFLVLARLHETAVNRDNTRRAERLKALLDTARDIREEGLPPEVRLVSRLLRADYPDESSSVLEEHRGLLNDDLLKVYDRYVEQIKPGIDEDTAERLDQIRDQMAAKITIQRA